MGYVNDPRTKGIVPDPERAPLIRQAFELYATGSYTLAKLRATLNGRGLTGARGGTLSKARYHYMLQNPLYCGFIRHHGELFEATHEPLVSKRLFDEVQAVMQQKSRPKSPASNQYLYRGVFHCGECGCMVTNERQKGHVYLRCTKKKGPCSQSYLDSARLSFALRDDASRGFGRGVSALVVADSGAGETFGLGGEVIAASPAPAKPAMRDGVQPADDLLNGQLRKKCRWSAHCSAAKRITRLLISRWRIIPV
jgi:hypothetical protein